MFTHVAYRNAARQRSIHVKLKTLDDADRRGHGSSVTTIATVTIVAEDAKLYDLAGKFGLDVHPTHGSSSRSC
jgi:hypothetical protein